MKKIYLFIFCIGISLLMHAQIAKRDQAAVLGIVGNKRVYDFVYCQN